MAPLLSLRCVARDHWAACWGDCCRSSASDKTSAGLPVELLPRPGDQAFVRQIAHLVPHGVAAADVEPQIQVAQACLPADFDLLEYGIGAEAVRRVLGIVEAVDSGQCIGGAVRDCHPDQPAREPIAELDRVRAALDQELLV